MSKAEQHNDDGFKLVVEALKVLRDHVRQFQFDHGYNYTDTQKLDAVLTKLEEFVEEDAE